MNERLQIRFVGGADVKPPSARSREIAQIIDSYEDAIATTVIEQHPYIKKEMIRVSLVPVQDESIGLTFEANLPEFSVPAAIKINRAIQQNAFHEISDRTKECLRKIVSFASKHKCDAHFNMQIDEQVIEAILTSRSQIPITFNLVGETVLYGEVKRAGGIEPTVEFQTVDGRTLYCPTTANIAIQLGKMLYQAVALKGDAKWDVDTFEVQDFVIREVVGYRKIPLHEAFESLREVVGNVFDQIDDVNQFVAELRNNGDPD